jgi:tetratricopeptide (TPR) repeat protein
LLKAGEHFRVVATDAVAGALPRAPELTADTKPAPTAAPQPSETAVAANPSGGTAKDDWEAAYRERRYAVAAARAREYGVERLLGSLSAPKLAELGDAARLGGDSNLALRALDALKHRFPNSAHAADADFLGGKLLAARGQTQPAIARFEQYLKAGQRAYTIEALGRLVELYSASGDSARARAAAERYLERAPHGPYRRLCESTLAKR